MDDHQQYQERLALHALDALDTAEARSLEAHLATCAESRAGTRANPPLETSARVVPMPIAPRRSNLWPNVLRVAAAVAIVGLLVGLIVMWRRDVLSRREIARITREKTRAENLLALERE